ncbi:two-component system sensor histidine kinase NtrB [Luteimonas terricola]|uniref:histidine kinase n=1 Tax=Luteimonas terricola TaxID=645597 RepID=A0ABQ2EPH1_9GAMM|nr:ATP-binding protein [Luteimonas terricola]GGK16277.1 two-component system sensor protein [Luteimonas terricola]
MPPGLEPAHDQLSTPVLAVSSVGVIEAGNTACGQWLGVSLRRLAGLPLAALEVQGDALARAVSADAAAKPRVPAGSVGASGVIRLPRLTLACPGAAPHFAEAWLTPRDDGGWLLELHPVDEFPGGDPVAALPLAMSAALKGLAHELRNPLAGLKGAAQLLARRIPGDDASSRELVTLVDSEVSRLAQLVDRMLDPAPPNPHVPLNVHAVLERVLRLAEADAGWAVKLVRDYDPSLPEIEGDADRLVQAVWNLARNAIEAGAGEVVLRTRAEHGVRIGSALHALALRLDIVDDGRGVPGELAEQVFVPLVSGRAEGSGLGLALGQQVAREHRGSLAFRSRPGHTVFTLLLPYAEEPGDGTH